MASNPGSLLRLLPSVDELLRRPEVARLAHARTPTYLASAARRMLAGWRRELAQGELDEARLRARVEHAGVELVRFVAAELQPLPRRVVNASGVIVHTNLGRAPWPQLAAERAVEAATRASALEYDVQSGNRGSREAVLSKLRLLFPEAEAVLAVNNCAAAVLLALNSLAEGREVIVSRGELVEIGGSFRIPDVMAKSGAVLREVGTTNRTRLGDYERAVTNRTAALLKVHPSNYRIVGFTESASSAELAELAQRRGLVMLEDLGSGLVMDLEGSNIHETRVQQALEAGVDLVMVSGDKLFGGPQAGLVLGRSELVEKLRSSPLYRALRPDKVCLAALDACAAIYLAGEPLAAIPVLRRISVPVEALKQRADQLAAELSKLLQETAEVRLEESRATVGGGSAPGSELPSASLGVTLHGSSAVALARGLRQADIPVIVRVEDDRVILDLRSVEPDEDALVVAAFVSATKT